MIDKTHLSTCVNELFAREQWRQAQRIIKRALSRDPDSHWLLTRLSTTYYEQRQYKKAYRLAREAHRLAPSCPLVLWDYAGCLDMMGQHMEAISVWKKLIRRGIARLSSDQCGEGVAWTRALLNDSRYRIAKAHFALGEYKSASIFVRLYLTKRSQGVRSIYRISQGRDLLSSVLKARRGG
jgi:tetratricopeptide (TPR) repeat protein